MLREVPKFFECLVSIFLFLSFNRDIPGVAPRWKALLVVSGPEFMKFSCTDVASKWCFAS